MGAAASYVEEVFAVLLDGHFHAAHGGAVLDELIRVQIDHVDAVIVRGQSPGDVHIGGAFIRLRNGQHGEGEGILSVHRIMHDPAQEGMHHGAVFQFFVDEGAVVAAAALRDGLHDIGAVAVHQHGVFPFRIGYFQLERAFHEIPQGLVGTHVPQLVALAVDLHDAHGHGVEGVPDHAVVLVGQEGKVVEVEPAHGVVIGGLPHILDAVPDILRVFFNDALRQGRLHEIVALQLGTADFLQEMNLILRFHALADGVHAQRGGHLHHFRQDDFAFVPLVEPPHEAHVKFDQVKLDALQHVQGGIPAAEIVHPHLEALGAEAFDLFLDVIEIAAQQAFRDLDVDQLPIHPRRVHQGADFLHQVAGVKIRPGKVDGNGDHLAASRFHGFQIPQHLPHDAKIQLGDQHGVLQHRNKRPWHQQAPHGIVPAGQGLHVAHLAVGGTDDGLVIHLNPAFIDGPVQVVDDLLAVFLFRQHVHIKERIVGFLVVFPHVGGQPRAVAGHGDFHRLDPIRINADAEGQGFAVVRFGAVRDQRV